MSVTDFPILKKDNLAEKVGNPYRDPNTGKFSFGIPGVKFHTGLETFKALPQATKDAATHRILAAGGNTVGVRIIGGKLRVVVMQDGRLLTKFYVNIDNNPEKGRSADAEQPHKKPEDLSDNQKDQILLAARQLDLDGKELEKYLEENAGLQLTEEFSEIIEHQRFEDLINYLHSLLLSNSDPQLDSKMVRVRTPRGYLRKVFSRLSEDQAVEVLDRLAANGWSEIDLEERVVAKMPKRLRDKIKEGKDGKKDSATEGP